MVIAIDGPAGSGKSTVARTVAAQTGMHYLNSGSYYRAVTWKVLQTVDPEDTDAVIRVAREIDISVADERMYVDGREVDQMLRADAVDMWVARHSAIPEVRHEVNRRLKSAAHTMDIVVEGRDITTVVFPHADFKVYLDASIHTRALRRFSQGTSELTLEEIEQSIRRRDEIDSTKRYGRLQVAPDALYLDTSHLTIEQVCDTVVSNIRGHDKTSGVTRHL